MSHVSQGYQFTQCSFTADDKTTYLKRIPLMYKREEMWDSQA